MAFNIQTFRTRALTAAIFVVVMLTGLLWNNWSFLILFSIIHFGCWWEYLKLIEKIHSIKFHPYIKMGLMVMGYGMMLWFCNNSFQVSGYGFKENISLPVSAAGFALLLTGIFQKNSFTIKSFGFAVLGLIYISLCWGFMLDIYGEIIVVENNNTYTFESWILPIAIIISIWINDTMAYMVGSFIGKTPLSKISPKKTWEGTLGGIILAIIVVGFLFASINSYAKANIIIVGFWFFIAAIAAITGTIGDLLESKIKRLAGVKDSGAIMPGHGGFLDRFDSLLLAIPFIWIFLQLIML